MTTVLPPPPRLVLFDFGNVLARIDHRRFVRALAGPLGISDDHSIEALKNGLFGQGTPGQRFETGLISPEEFRRQAEAVFGHSWSSAVFDAAFARVIYDPIPETIELIEWLTGKARLGLLSNTSALHFSSGIKSHPAFSQLDQVTLSFEVKAMKPDPRIFEDALRKFGGDPHEVLFLDDIQAFVDKARDMGMKSRLFADPVKDCAAVRALFAPNLEVI